MHSIQIQGQLIKLWELLWPTRSWAERNKGGLPQLHEHFHFKHPDQPSNSPQLPQHLVQFRHLATYVCDCSNGVQSTILYNRCGSIKIQLRKTLLRQYGLYEESPRPKCGHAEWYFRERSLRCSHGNLSLC